MPRLLIGSNPYRETGSLIHCFNFPIFSFLCLCLPSRNNNLNHTLVKNKYEIFRLPQTIIFHQIVLYVEVSDLLNIAIKVDKWTSLLVLWPRFYAPKCRLLGLSPVRELDPAWFH